jgi:predicted small secreted protein
MKTLTKSALLIAGMSLAACSNGTLFGSGGVGQWKWRVRCQRWGGCQRT